MISKYDSKEYKRSRIAYSMQCTFEYFITILVGDAFLAKLLSSMGISDSLIGIISSFVTLAFLFQLSSVFLINKIRNTKRAAILFTSTSQLLFMILYIIPFLSLSRGMKTAFAIIFILGAYFSNYFITSILFKWANSYVSPTKRGSYSATKEMISLASGMVFTLVAGKVVDHFESIGRLETGFIIIAATIFLLCLCNFISLLMIQGETKEKEHVDLPLRRIINNTFKNKAFVNIIILTCIWDVARYVTIGFLGTYKTKELFFTVGTVQIINIVGNLFRFFASKPFGRFSDKYSFAAGIKLAFIIAAVGFLANIFTTPDTRWLIVVYTVLFAVSNAGTNQNSMNIVYNYVDADYFVPATAIKNSIGGVCGFCATLIGSKLVSVIQANGNMIFGIQIYAQQLLSLISLIMIIIGILFIKFVIQKQEIIEQ